MIPRMRPVQLLGDTRMVAVVDGIPAGLVDRFVRDESVMARMRVMGVHTLVAFTDVEMTDAAAAWAAEVVAPLLG